MPFLCTQVTAGFHPAPSTTWCPEQCQCSWIPAPAGSGPLIGLCSVQQGVCTGFLRLGRQGHGKLPGRKEVLPPLTRRVHCPAGAQVGAELPVEFLHLGLTPSLLTPALPQDNYKALSKTAAWLCQELAPAP